MPQAVLRMDAQHQRAGVHRFTSRSPLLKRVVGGLFRRPGKRVQRQSAEFLCEGIADMAAPAV